MSKDAMDYLPISNILRCPVLQNKEGIAFKDFGNIKKGDKVWIFSYKLPYVEKPVFKSYKITDDIVNNLKLIPEESFISIVNCVYVGD